MIIKVIQTWIAEKTLTRDFKKLFGNSESEVASGLRDFFRGYLEVTKQYIKEEAYKDILGADKKAAVDKAVCDYIDTSFASCKNRILLAIVSLAKEKVVPALTQVVYDLLKERVDNL